MCGARYGSLDGCCDPDLEGVAASSQHLLMFISVDAATSEEKVDDVFLGHARRTSTGFAEARALIVSSPCSSRFSTPTMMRGSCFG